MEVVKVKDLSKIYTEGYTKVMALRGVNLSVKEKEFIAITGPSGSGKSTLLNLIGGLDKPYEGKVIVNNKDIYKMSDEELTIFRRREIGYIFQFYNLIPTITVKDNILLPLELDNREVDSKYLDEIVGFMNIKDMLNFYPSSLSGGQKQRVAIARALITKPSIILADEPTGNLDTKTAKDVINLMKLSVLKYHQTLIMITHDPTIAAHADRTIKLVDGRIIGGN
ncbi:ABC transporter ATP-binding protein [Oceanirhabdus sp. W0125-5]|uniref:ABC transporter ATP-binding protein n=1 Tax=Oceanirhabdus sp. W0125-5 TaxID=2999116 RepID=UPI0022F30C10|nr:ABC transporter ATP-binding protein [Oceanirhabdus sp. W0125-5]WBW97644.1 ABC transporter ATP-binding protein [Oceanirhabdus sp. W0125-5]